MTKIGSVPQVFLGGLPSSITETDLRSFFTRYGEVVEVVIMYDQVSKLINLIIVMMYKLSLSMTIHPQ